MLKNSAVIAFIIFLFVGLFFYNKSILKGEIPFPGDLLISEYTPYNNYSFLGYAPGSFPNKAQNIDVLEQLYPWKHFSIESLKSMDIPLWNPYNFSGTPHLAAIQSGTFYPFNLFFFVLPFNVGWTLYIVLQPVLAGFFTCLFLRELKLSTKSSLFGGLAFSFSSFLVVWMQYGNIIHAALWLPIVMAMGLKNLRNPSIAKSILIAIVLSLSIFAGHFQISIYLYAFSFAFLFYMNVIDQRKNWIRNLIILSLVYVFSLLISAVQLLPSIEIFLSSSRSDYTYSRLIEFLIPSYHFISILFPDFFGNPVSRNYWLSGTYIERVTYFGIVPFFFALYAFFSKKSLIVWFFIVSASVIFLITFDTFITRFLYSIYIPPIIATSVPTRAIFILVFSGSVLAAFGFDNFEKARKTKPLVLSILTILLITLSAWIFVILGPKFFIDVQWMTDISIATRNLVIPSAALSTTIVFVISYSFRDRKLLKRYSKVITKGMFIAIFSLTFIELYFFFNKFTPFSPKEFIYPSNSAFEFVKQNQETYRTWGYGSANLEVNIQTYEKIYSTDGYDPFYIKRYGELLSSTENGKVSNSIERADAALAQGFGGENLKNNQYRQKIMDMLGVKYVLHKKSLDNFSFDNTFDRERYSLVWNDNELQIYENKGVLPRAYLVDEYFVISDDSEIIEEIYDLDFNPARQLIVEEDPVLIKSDESLDYDLRIDRYSDNNVDISTNSNKEALLFLSDAYFPGWKVYVDDREEKIYRANYSFRAVKIPEGNHRIKFSYEPMSFSLGVGITGGALLLAALGISISYYKNRKK